jgi:hypothetical protein
MEVPAMAGAPLLLPGLLKGYGRIERRLGAIEGALRLLAERLTRIERGLGIDAS